MAAQSDHELPKRDTAPRSQDEHSSYEHYVQQED